MLERHLGTVKDRAARVALRLRLADLCATLARNVPGGARTPGGGAQAGAAPTRTAAYQLARCSPTDEQLDDAGAAAGPGGAARPRPVRRAGGASAKRGDAVRGDGRPRARVPGAGARAGAGAGAAAAARHAWWSTAEKANAAAGAGARAHARGAGSPPPSRGAWPLLAARWRSCCRSPLAGPAWPGAGRPGRGAARAAPGDTARRAQAGSKSPAERPRAPRGLDPKRAAGDGASQARGGRRLGPDGARAARDRPAAWQLRARGRAAAAAAPGAAAPALVEVRGGGGAWRGRAGPLADAAAGAQRVAARLASSTPSASPKDEAAELFLALLAEGVSTRRWWAGWSGWPPRACGRRRSPGRWRPTTRERRPPAAGGVAAGAADVHDRTAEQKELLDAAGADPREAAGRRARGVRVPRCAASRVDPADASSAPRRCGWRASCPRTPSWPACSRTLGAEGRGPQPSRSAAARGRRRWPRRAGRWTTPPRRSRPRWRASPDDAEVLARLHAALLERRPLRGRDQVLRRRILPSPRARRRPACYLRLAELDRSCSRPREAAQALQEAIKAGADEEPAAAAAGRAATSRAAG